MTLQRLQFQNISYCTSNERNIFEAIMNGYNTALLLILLALTFLTSLIHSSVFSHEALLSLRSLAIILIPLPFQSVAEIILKNPHSFKVENIQPLLWMDFTRGVLLTVLIMLVLFVPHVRALKL